MKTIYLDIDGVLADFHSESFRVHKKTPFKITAWDYHRDMGLIESEFYAPMGAVFWEGLPWTAEGQALLRGLEAVVGRSNIALVTSPILTHGCLEGKRAWVWQNVPHYSDQLFIGHRKELLAGPDKLLIDDGDHNIKAFAKAGGVALTVPRPWNARAANADADGRFDVDDLLRRVRRIFQPASRPAAINHPLLC